MRCCLTCFSRASQAVKCLERVHSLKKRSLMPNSLYLDRLLRQARGGGGASGGGGSLDRRTRPMSGNQQQLLAVLDKVSVTAHLLLLLASLLHDR